MGVRRLIYGVGLNDADYQTFKHDKVDGRRKMTWICPYYSRWTSMLRRCYSKGKRETSYYSDCYVCDEWLTFSNFKAWMEKQDWEGKDLDKDLLARECKVYSPETCVFISSTTNSFLVKYREYVKGVSTGIEKRKNGFRVVVNDPMRRYSGRVGSFRTLDEARRAWKERKHQYACELADSPEHVTDERAKEALRNIYK